MKDVVEIVLEHQGVVGLLLCLLAYWLHQSGWARFGDRDRIEWKDVAEERAREHAKRAEDLRRAAKLAGEHEARRFEELRLENAEEPLSRDVSSGHDSGGRR